MKKTAQSAIGAFLQREVLSLEKGVTELENLAKEIAAWLTKEQPTFDKILQAALAAYKFAVAAMPQIEATIQALAILIADLSVAL